MNIGTIQNPLLKVKPSEKLYDYIKNYVKVQEQMPCGIKNIVLDRKQSEHPTEKGNCLVRLTDEDHSFINQLNLADGLRCKNTTTDITTVTAEVFLSLRDLHWIYQYISGRGGEIYFHELFEGSEIILPKNSLIPRNEELAKRCLKYKNELNNKKYFMMTRRVSCARSRFPDDTVAYHIKELNKQIIAAFQLVVSIFAGFAFGFMGIEVFIGSVANHIRILLGVVFAFTIAITELYFLAKKLDANASIEDEVEQAIKSAKLD